MSRSALISTFLILRYMLAPAIAAAADAPVARRYIAVLKADQQPLPGCPEISGWKGTGLFDPALVPSPSGHDKDANGNAVDDKGNRNKKESAKQRPPLADKRPPLAFRPLARFCQYLPLDPNAKDLKPPASKLFARIDPDYDVLLQQGSLGRDPAVREALNTIYRTMLDLGPIEQAKSQPLYTSKDAGDVARVAVIDTARGYRSYAGADPHTKHGLAMAEIINEVRCPAREPACRKNLSFVDAFPWRGKATDDRRAALPGSSDNLGSLGSLAQAIFIAVSSWRVDNALRNTEAPLVLNLSLGWDPGPGKAPQWAKDWDFPRWDILAKENYAALEPRSDRSATAQAVQAALVYASCFDVLAIAAAGNNPAGGYNQRGALAPAKWEKLLKPTLAQCRLHFGDAAMKAQRTGNTAIKVDRAPLIYAVAPEMTGLGDFLPNYRFGGVSLHITPASHVVAGAGSARTDPWSGSSVAAATYSGLAAALWSYDRRLSPHQVMALIDARGESTGYGASLIRENSTDGAAEAPTPKVTATSADPYEAFKWLCEDRCGGYENPYKPFNSTSHTEHFWSIPLAKVIATIINPPHRPRIPMLGGTPVPLTVVPDTTPGVPQTHYYPASQSTPPEIAPTLGAPPWTQPQPETPICPVCPVSNKTLVLSPSEDPLAIKLGRDGKFKLDNPLLEFRFKSYEGADQGFIAVSLGTIEVGPEGLQIPLDRYTIKLGETEIGLGTALEQERVAAGTLTIFLKDQAGVRSLVSVVQVLLTK